MSKRGITLVILAVVAVGLLVYSQLKRGPLRISGFVEAYEIRVGSRVGGRVQKVFIDEGDHVKQGQLLVALEPFDFHEKRSQAQAELEARTADYEKLVKGFRVEEIGQAKAMYDQLAARLTELRNGPRKEEIVAAKARLRSAEAEVTLAQRSFDRTERTFASKVSTQEEMDQANNTLRSARATLEVRQAELALLHEGTRPEQIEQAKAQLEDARQALLLRKNGSRLEDIAAANAAKESAAAALKATDQQIAELNVLAPLDAVVEAVDLRPGDMVAANAPILSLMDVSRLWIRAYVPENTLNLTIDQPAWITVDSFPNQQFRGHISFIARQAEFTPNNVQTPEERSKQVFRIRVTLDEGLDRLRPGMSADVWLEGEPK
jgi:multidrug resistance efflux pump